MTKHGATRDLTLAERRRYALEASCDYRTIDKVLAGEPVRGLAGDRARAVLERAGLLQPVLRAPTDPVELAERQGLRARVDALETTIAAGKVGAP